MSPTQTLVAEPRVADLEETVDREALLMMLRDKDRLLQELEDECRGLAEQLVAFQSEILKWVELDR